jgi:hypothetical protein
VTDLQQKALAAVPNESFSNIRSETPSRSAFSVNLKRVSHFYDLIDADLKHIERQLDALPTGAKTPLDMQAARERAMLAFDEGKTRRETVQQWVPVILVTFTEAYLQDVLAYLASIDSSVMERSEQSAKYTDVLAAESIGSLAGTLRERWARGVVDEGGPPKWISRFEKMGARGYRSNLGTEMDLLWGVRHVVVHAAGFATQDFIRRHPELGLAVRERIRVDGVQIGEWLDEVTEFVDTTDKYIVARTASAINIKAKD